MRIDLVALKMSDANIAKNQKIYLHPRDELVSMKIDKHHYFVEGEHVKTSCTGYLSRIFNHFDREGVVARVVRRESNIMDARGYTLSEWNRSGYLGTRVHKMIEDHLLWTHEGIPLEEESQYDESWFESGISEKCKERLRDSYNRAGFVAETTKRFESFLRFYNIWSKSLKFCASEYLIYGQVGDEVVCGTIDALFWSNEERREVVIVDWKTNKEIDGYYSTIVNEASPKHGLQANNFTKYTCQIHVYKQLLEQNYNVKVVGGYIVHLKNDNFIVYECPLGGCNCIP